MHLDLSQKICCRCGERKDATDFNFKSRARGLRHTFCRDCQHIWNRKHYERNRATYIANAKRNTAVYQAEMFRRLVAYLRSHPCVDCTESDPLVLEFDHIDRATKSDHVSRLIAYSSWHRIDAEIAKCEVRCANCHRRRTAQQLGWRKALLAGAAGLEPATSDFGDRRSTN